MNAMQPRDPKFALYSETFQGAISAMSGGERGIRTLVGKFTTNSRF